MRWGNMPNFSFLHLHEPSYFGVLHATAAIAISVSPLVVRKMTFPEAMGQNFCVRAGVSAAEKLQ
jgi:hypothetical protein